MKHYLQGALPTKGLTNEVCGHILAGATGLPVPDQALIVELPAERVAEMHPEYVSRVRGPKVALWATRDVGGRPLPPDPNLAGPSLRLWPALPDLIAFDTWVVIPDRTAANLARRRNRQLVVIDHGHLAGSVCWEADMLPFSDERPHPFLALWHRTPGEVNQRIIVAAERLEDCLAKAEPELNRFLEPLLDSPRVESPCFGFYKNERQAARPG